jgi:hypothetical protein
LNFKKPLNSGKSISLATGLYCIDDVFMDNEAEY